MKDKMFFVFQAVGGIVEGDKAFKRKSGLSLPLHLKKREEILKKINQL